MSIDGSQETNLKQTRAKDLKITDVDPNILPYLPNLYRGFTMGSDPHSHIAAFPLQDAVRYAEYFRQIEMEGKKIVAAVLPGIYKDLPVHTTFSPKILPGVKEGAARVEMSPNLDEDYGIIFRFASPPTPGNEGRDVVDAFSLVPGISMHRIMRDLLTYVHEYAHELFNELVLEPQRYAVMQARSNKYRLADGTFKFPLDLNTTQHAIDEGFAVTVETIAAEAMLSDYKKFNTSEEMVTDIRTFTNARKTIFSNNELNANSAEQKVSDAGKRAMAYNDGYFIVSDFYNKGGIQGLRRFLYDLDPMKLYTGERDDQEFQISLKAPERTLQFYGKIS